MSWRSLLIFDRSWATSKLAGGGGCGVGGAAGEVREDTVGGATSNILSAMLVRVLRETVSPEEASTMRTWLRSHWKNSSWRRALSGWGPAESPRSCSIRCSSCVGFRSPSSSEVKRSCATCANQTSRSVGQKRGILTGHDCYGGRDKRWGVFLGWLDGRGISHRRSLVGR